MQDPRTTSTLELVVNEQQLQNMSQIDLSRPADNNQTNEAQQTQQQTHQDGQLFSFKAIKEWPTRFKANFNAKMDEAKAKSDTNTQFVFEVLQAFSGVVVWILCFIGTIIVPVILFLIGLVNLDSCTDRPPLPYLVLATGFVMTASNLFNLALSFDLPVLTNHEFLSSDTKNTIASIINIIFNCVVAFLYILCGYFVYTTGTVKSKPKDFTNITETTTESPANTDLETSSLDCNGLLYYFTFWFISVTLGLFVVLSIVGCLFFGYNRYRLAIIRGSTPRSQTTTNNTNQTTNSYATNGV